jgi:hypothetical protein
VGVVDDFPQRIFSTAILDRDLPVKAIHLSIANKRTAGWEMFRASAAKYGCEKFLNLEIIPGSFRFSLKIDYLAATLPGLPDDALVVMTDALDVLFNAPLDHLVAAFKNMLQEADKDSFGRPLGIVFSGEKKCFPDAGLASRHPEVNLTKPFPFLNSGVIVGWKPALLQVLGRFGWNIRLNDQAYWMEAYLQSLEDGSLPRMSVDHCGHMACSIHGLVRGELGVSGAVFLFRDSKIRPALLHFNGPSKKWMATFAKRMGLEIPKGGGGT